MSWDAEKFFRAGYQVIPAEQPELLVELRRQLVSKAKSLIEHENAAQDDAGFLDEFHQHNLVGAPLNDVRLELIRYCTHELAAGRVVRDAFAGTLLQMIGPDVVIQKTVNLVIHQPGDADVVPTHRDTPLHSPFEIVVWLPLVDVFGTKSMYLLDRAETQTALQSYEDPDKGYREVDSFAAREGTDLEVPFGSACIFWPGLIHGCHINRESETRWSFNIRYKNLFSPYGSKGIGSYFKLDQLSALARLALESEREQSP